MAVLGSLTAILRADTRKFKKDMTGAQKTVAGFKKSFGSLAATASKVGAIFGGVSVAGLAYFVKKQMQAIDATSKLADRIGMTTEALVGFQHAANLTGAGAETLGSSLGAMSKRIGEAGEGFGSGKRALEQMGLAASDLINLGMDEQLLIIADKIKDMATQSERAAAVSGLFSRAGLGLVNMLELGSEGLKEMREEADRLGLTFTRAEGWQVEQANDSLQRMQDVMVGVGREMATYLAPLIEAGGDAFREWATDGEGAAGKIVSALDDVIQAAAKVADLWDVVQGGFQVVGGAIMTGSGYILEATDATTKFFDAEIKGLSDLADVAREKGVEKFEEGLGNIKGGFMGESAAAARKEIAAIRESSKERAASWEQRREERRLLDAENRADEERLRKRLAHAKKIAAEVKSERESRVSMAESAQKELDRMVQLAHMSEQDRENSDLLFKIQELRAAGLWNIAEQYALILALREQEARTAQATADIDEKRLERITKEKELLEEQVKASADAATETRDLAKAGKERVRDMQQELQMMRAANDFERRRIQLKRELQEAIKKANGNEEEIALATGIANEKLADIQQDIAEDAEREAKARKEAADEGQRLADAMRQNLDITKRFAALPGSGGMFGFGKGRVGQFSGFHQNDWRRGTSVKSRRRTAGVAAPQQVAAPGEVAAPEGLTDLSPEVQKILTQWQKIPPLWEKLGTALHGLESGVTSGVDRMGKSTEKSVGKLRDTVRDLKTKVASFEKRIERAGSISAGGR